MKKYLTACVLLALSFTACENRQGETDPKEIAEDQNEVKFDNTQTEGDAEFAVKAANGGLMEVELGKLAQSKGTDQHVKDFGAMMVTDHSAANKKLTTLAQNKNISLPAIMSEEKQRKYDDLNKKDPKDFDKAYISFMVKDHKEDIEEFKEQAEQGKDAEIKTWAASQIATLEHHLSKAQEIDSILSHKK